MGQAKRRGTKEERKAQAMEREDLREEERLARLASMSPEEKARNRRTLGRLAILTALASSAFPRGSAQLKANRPRRGPWRMKW